MEPTIAPVVGYRSSTLYVGNLLKAAELKINNPKNIKTNLNLSGFRIGNPYEIYIADFQDRIGDYRGNKAKIIRYAAIVNNSMQKGNVLVNCVAGQNRAPTVIAAYLILYHNFAPNEAIDYIRRINAHYRNMRAIDNVMFADILQTLG